MSTPFSYPSFPSQVPQADAGDGPHAHARPEGTDEDVTSGPSSPCVGRYGEGMAVETVKKGFVRHTAHANSRVHKHYPVRRPSPDNHEVGETVGEDKNAYGGQVFRRHCEYMLSTQYQLLRVHTSGHGDGLEGFIEVPSTSVAHTSRSVSYAAGAPRPRSNELKLAGPQSSAEVWMITGGVRDLRGLNRPLLRVVGRGTPAPPLRLPF